MQGTFILYINLVEHHKQIRAHRCATDVGDNRITTQDTEETHDDMIDALDDIGIMNLENAMKV